MGKFSIGCKWEFWYEPTQAYHTYSRPMHSDPKPINEELLGKIQHTKILMHNTQTQRVRGSPQQRLRPWGTDQDFFTKF